MKHISTTALFLAVLVAATLVTIEPPPLRLASSALAVTQVSVWPALNTTVTLQDGITTVGADGAVLPYTSEVAGLLRTGRLLTRDPRAGSTGIVDYPTSALDSGAPIFTSQLATRAGAYNGQAVVINGYTNGVTRCSGRTYRWNSASSATHNGGSVVGQSTVGRWLLQGEGSVDVTCFGARGDDSTDDTAAVQAAINYAIDSGVGRVFMPQGGYRISKTLQLGKAGTFVGIRLDGIGMNFGKNLARPGTYIRATHSDSPAINIQAARYSSVSKLAIVGAAEDYILGVGYGDVILGAAAQTSRNDTDLADWDAPGLASNADSRYAPYAAITVDGWSGSAPSPAYPTDVMAYGQSVSSGVLIEDVLVSGFNTGIAIHASNNDLQGDYTTINRCSIQAVKYGISTGNAQSRNVAITNTNFVFFHTALTTNTHGFRTGKFGSTISGCDFTAGINVFKLGSSSIYGPLEFRSCHSESMWRLGDVTHSTTSEHALIFANSEWGFGSQTEWRGYPATILANSGSTATPVKFIGGALHSFPSVLMFAQDGMSFEGTSVRPSDRQAATIASEYLVPFHNATCGGIIFPKLRTEADNTFAFTAYNIGTRALAGRTIAAAGTKSFTSRPYGVPAWIQSAAPNQASSKNVFTQVRDSVAWAKSSLTSVSFTQSATKPGELTLVWPGFMTDAKAQQEGQATGDVILDEATGTVFVIRSWDSTTRTNVAEAQNNYRFTAGAYTTLTSFSTTVGNLYFLNTRIYTPTYPVLADAPEVLTGSATYNPASLATGAVDSTQTVTITGAALGNFAEPSFSLDMQGLQIDAWVSATDTVSYRARNPTAGTVDLNSGTVRFRVRKHASMPATLTNVGRDDGYAAFLDTDVIDDATTGDRVYVDPYGDGWISQANSMVTAQSTGSLTMTFAGAPTRSFTRKLLPWWVRRIADSASR